MDNATPHTILIIEDSQNLRDLYAAVLSQNGYQVKLAADGEEGLMKLRQGGHDLIFLDMQLPKLNGLDVLKQLKAQPIPEGTKPNGKIVLMTNMSDDALIKEAAELGAPTHIIKTDITPTVLLEKIKTLLA